MIVYENEVVGKVVVDANRDEDGLHFGLEGGWWFSLFNNLEISEGEKSSDEKSLIGKRLRRIGDYDGEIVFRFERGVSVSMSLQDEDYNGPESMNVWAPDGRIFVAQ